MRNLSILFTALSVVLFLSGCDQLKNPGSFEIVFSWEEGEEPDFAAKEYYLWAKIVDFSDNSVVISSAEAVKIASDGSFAADLSGDTYGDDFKAVVEIRDGSTGSHTKLYTGHSERFEITRGKHTKVVVDMAIQPMPGVGDTGEKTDITLSFIDENGETLNIANTFSHRMRFTGLNNVATVVLSENPDDFLLYEVGETDGLTIYQLSELVDVDGENGLYDLPEAFTLNDAGEGRYTVRALLLNALGETSQIVSNELLVDRTGATLSIDISPVNYVNALERMTITVSANTFIRGESVSANLSDSDGNNIGDLDCTDCSGISRSFTLNFPEGTDLSDGQYTITAHALDEAGNQEKTPGTADFTLDRTDPEISNITIFRDGEEITDYTGKHFTKEAVLSISYTLGDEEDSITLKLGEKALSNNEITINETDFPEGIYSLTATLSDAAGNTKTVEIDNNLHVDYTPPEITLVPTGDSVYNASETVSFTVFSKKEELSAAPSVSAGDTLLTSKDDSRTEWTFEPTLDDGIHGVSVTEAKDLAGNDIETPITASLTVDRTFPSVSDFSINDPDTGDSVTKVKHGDEYTISFDILETELDSDPVVRFDDTVLDSCTTSPALHVECSLTAVVDDRDGTHHFQAGITDAAGNNSPNIQLGEVEYDVTGPQVTGADFRADSQFPYPVADDVYSFSRYEPYSENVNTVYLNVYSNETLDETFTPVLTYSGGGSTDFSQAVISGKKVTFDITFTDSVPAGETKYTYQIQWQDEIGNIVTRDVPVSMIIKDDPAEKPSGEDLILSNIVFRRVPWGADSTGGDPYFSIKMDDETETAVEAGSNITEFSVYNSNGGMVGTLAIDGEGKLTETEINSGDQTKLYLNPVNQYGVKQFDPDEIQSAIADGSVKYTTEIQWTATMGGKVPGSTFENPHRFIETPMFTTVLEQDASVTTEPDIQDIGNITTVDTQSIIRNAEERWREIQCNTDKPSTRTRHAIAYDSTRGKVVLFGGWTGSECNNETWEWDGMNWEQKIPTTKPSARSGHAMAYDSARGKVVLFGGSSGGNETWEWDGTNWEQKNPATTPSARGDHAMAYDSARREVILFGGAAGAEISNETWGWNGTNWEQKDPVTIPSERRNHAMSYDSTRGEVVLFGGSFWGNSNSETWVWDGTNWEQKTPTNRPTAREYHAIAYDSARGKVILFGGRNSQSSGQNNETWEWNGTSWKQKHPATKPSARRAHAMAYNNAQSEVVLFGGSSRGDETWTWKGTNWKQKTPATKPVARTYHAVAYDSARGKVVLFGGYAAGYSNETWEWEKTNWEQKNPAITPSARRMHAMAYDSTRGKVVLFGGETDSGYSNETWVWDGTDWEQKNPAITPSARRLHAMAYDSTHKKVVLFGGETDSGYSNETWVWDGTNWEQKTSVPGPSARQGHAMVYNSTSGKMFLFGGSSDGGETWVWDGTNWEQKTTATTPSERMHTAMAYDRARGKMVLFGGTTGSDNDETWEYNNGSFEKPTQLTRFVFGAAGTYENNPTIISINSSAYSGGTGYNSTDCSAVNSAKMLVWNTAYKSGAWIEAANNQAGVDNPQKLEFSTKDPELVKHLFFGDEKSINIAVMPSAESGCGDEMGSISTDYIEITIRYTIDESYTPPDAYCGNGVVNDARNEECDDGNYANGDGCSILCRNELCGNGSVDPGELCDKTAPGDSNLYCADDCMNIIGRCGDLNIDEEVGETCDDGNTFDDGNGCDETCHINAVCGNGTVEIYGETCEQGDTVDCTSLSHDPPYTSGLATCLDDCTGWDKSACEE